LVIAEYTLKDFTKLFAGRDDVYGSNEGGCVKQPLTADVLHKHFSGVAPIGIYPVVPAKGDFYVGWGCVDFDTSDSESHAVALYDALEAAGVQSYIERSRSKGYHVWVFAKEPVLAKHMRNMLLVASQVAGTPTTEVNPKQVSLGRGSYGNYVRLPYPNLPDRYTDKQRVLYRQSIDKGPYSSPMLFIDFVAQALQSRTPPDVIEAISSMYQGVIKSNGSMFDIEYDATLDEAMSVLSPLGKVIWRDGPLAGKDRSSTLTKLGHESVRSGLNPSQTKTILVTADKRWGKYHSRPNGVDEIDKLVVRVHS
jgi:hypothetical protein